LIYIYGKNIYLCQKISELSDKWLCINLEAHTGRTHMLADNNNKLSINTMHVILRLMLTTVGLDIIDRL